MGKPSRFLSLILRHKPDEACITLDPHGWTDVDNLVRALTNRFPSFTVEDLEEEVASNEKKRFEFDVTGTKIRACQGHSVNVDLQLKPTTPPDLLWHGTSVEAIESILDKGLEKRSRHAVHLTEDKDRAFMTGERHGNPVVFAVMAELLSREGHPFYQSANGVWLTDFVPRKSLAGPFYKSDKFLNNKSVLDILKEL